jgi:hypothetical protein
MNLICDKIKGNGVVFYRKNKKKEEKEEEIGEEERGGHLAGYNLNITDGFIDN